MKKRNIRKRRKRIIAIFIHKYDKNIEVQNFDTNRDASIWKRRKEQQEEHKHEKLHPKEYKITSLNDFFKD